MLVRLKKTLNLIKQASYNNKKILKLPLNSLNIEILSFLYREGFLNYYMIDKKNHLINVGLNLNTSNGKNLIRDFSLYSHNKRLMRNFTLKDLKFKRYKLLGLSTLYEFKVFLTNKGLLSLEDCLNFKIGGILLFSINY